MQEHFEAGHVCWDDNDVVGGRPTGAVRISFGFSSTQRDASAVLDFVRTHFVGGSPSPAAATALPHAGGGTPRLAAIWVYPIKACRGCRQHEWPLGDNGLLYDREWALVGEDDEVLTLKKCPRLACIQPRLDLRSGEHPSLPSCHQHVPFPGVHANIAGDGCRPDEGGSTLHAQRVDDLACGGETNRCTQSSPGGEERGRRRAPHPHLRRQRVQHAGRQLARQPACCFSVVQSGPGQAVHAGPPATWLPLGHTQARR